MCLSGTTTGHRPNTSHTPPLFSFRSDYLPDACRDPFEAVVGKFIFKPLKWRMKYAEFLKQQAAEESAQQQQQQQQQQSNGGDGIGDIEGLRAEVRGVHRTGTPSTTGTPSNMMIFLDLFSLHVWKKRTRF